MWDLLGENGFLHLIEEEMARVLNAPFFRFHHLFLSKKKLQNFSVTLKKA